MAVITVVAPAVAIAVIEVFGGSGVSEDTSLAYSYAWSRAASSTIPMPYTVRPSPRRIRADPARHDQQWAFSALTGS